MKKFLSVIATIKTGACLCFTAWAAVWGVLALVFWPDASLRAGHILSMLAASLWIGFLQWLCFVRETGHRVSYGARIVLFAAGLFPVLAACAYFQRWFPAENTAAWVGFTALFFLLLAVFTLCFEVAFAIQGKRYAGLLGEYHRRRDGQSAPPQNSIRQQSGRAVFSARRVYPHRQSCACFAQVAGRPSGTCFSQKPCTRPARPAAAAF